MKITKEHLKSIILEELEASLLEQDDANAQIDKAQIEAQKIAGKLAQELEKVSKTSGLDVATLANLVSQFIAQES